MLLLAAACAVPGAVLVLLLRLRCVMMLLVLLFLLQLFFLNTGRAHGRRVHRRCMLTMMIRLCARWFALLGCRRGVLRLVKVVGVDFGGGGDARGVQARR